MISLSLTGLTDPSTWVTFSSSKHLNTCSIASVSRIFARNLFPRPSPLLAPFTRPAIATISTVVGTIRCGLTNSESLFKRSSGTVMTPTFGSIVQKGKFAACALAFDKQLKRVDLPTLGRPTIPHCNAIFIYQLIDCSCKGTVICRKNKNKPLLLCFSSSMRFEPVVAPAVIGYQRYLHFVYVLHFFHDYL